ncbi:MAG TPA: hypothetical protein VMV77_05735 [Bacteroidales bacterium]|nr:hypothetical protein [Bacteroidales bacterium]
MRNSHLIPDPPDLSPDLASIYHSLPSNYQKLFTRIIKYLWGVVHSRRYLDRGGVLFSFWVDRLRDRLSLTSSELSLLTFIYQMTIKGKNIIHSDDVYNGMVLPGVLKTAKQNYLSLLAKRGYITRSYHGSGAPYRSFAHPVYIKLSFSGVALVEGIERDLYKLLLNTSLDDLTGRNKKT